MNKRKRLPRSGKIYSIRTTNDIHTHGSGKSLTNTLFGNDIDRSTPFNSFSCTSL